MSIRWSEIIGFCSVPALAMLGAVALEAGHAPESDPRPLLVIDGAKSGGKDPIRLSERAYAGGYLTSWSRPGGWAGDFEVDTAPRWTVTCLDVLDSRHAIIDGPFGPERVELSSVSWGIPMRADDGGAESAKLLLQRLQRMAVGHEFLELNGLGEVGRRAPARCAHGARIANLRWPDGETLIGSFEDATLEWRQVTRVADARIAPPIPLSEAELQASGAAMVQAAEAALGWHPTVPVRFTLIERAALKAKHDADRIRTLEACPVNADEQRRDWEEATAATVRERDEVLVVRQPLDRDQWPFLLAHEVGHIYQMQALGVDVAAAPLPTSIIEAHASAIALRILAPGQWQRALDVLLSLGDYTNYWRAFEQVCTASGFTPDQALQWLLSDPERCERFNSLVCGLRSPCTWSMVECGSTVIDGLQFTALDPVAGNRLLVEIRNTLDTPFTGLFTGPWSSGESGYITGPPPFRLHLESRAAVVIDLGEHDGWPHGEALLGEFAAAVDPAR